jgi:NAD(P)-dependent dehydrogenase (short-subunit alcohol dehydrogenase family)
MALLQDRIAFVTGAGSGIGAAGARAMAREGAVLVVTDRDGAAAESVAAEIHAAGGRCEARTVDVSQDAELTDAILDTIDRHGRLDVLHSHAGIQIEGTLEQVDVADFDASWALNVRAHFVAAKAVVGQMRRQGGGSVIITSSNSGVQYDREMIAYATTKHASVAMTRQLAADYARDRIRFNALCPGFVDTPFNRGFEVQMGGRAQLERYIAEQIPMGRWGTVEEIAQSIVFLASNASAFMTGQAFTIDGGECL